MWPATERPKPQGNEEKVMKFSTLKQLHVSSARCCSFGSRKISEKSIIES